MDICGCSFYFNSFWGWGWPFPHIDNGRGLQVRFCHSDMEWCLLEEECQASKRHGQDSVTGLNMCGSGAWTTMIKHWAVVWKSWMLDAVFGEKHAGLQNPGGNSEGGTSAPGLCARLHLDPHRHSHPALTNSPMHFCSFKLWGTFLGMGAQIQQEDYYNDFDKVTETIYPNWNERLEKHCLLPPPVYNHIFVLSVRVKVIWKTDEGKKFMGHCWKRTNVLQENQSFLNIVWDRRTERFP